MLPNSDMTAEGAAPFVNKVLAASVEIVPYINRKLMLRSAISKPRGTRSSTRKMTT